MSEKKKDVIFWILLILFILSTFLAGLFLFLNLVIPFGIFLFLTPITMIIFSVYIEKKYNRWI